MYFFHQALSSLYFLQDFLLNLSSFPFPFSVHVLLVFSPPAFSHRIFFIPWFVFHLSYCNPTLHYSDGFFFMSCFLSSRLLHLPDSFSFCNEHCDSSKQFTAFLALLYCGASTVSRSYSLTFSCHIRPPLASCLATRRRDPAWFSSFCFTHVPLFALPCRSLDLSFCFHCL